MQEFIDIFGKNNLMIIVAVIGAIILALIIIMIIEKIDNKRRSNSDDFVDYYKENDVVDDSNEIIYVDDEPSEEEAKQTLEDVQKKLVNGDYDNDIANHTHFELEQEEKSIISYDELMNASIDFDSENDKLLDDDGSEPISIDELYKLHVEENDKESYENPLYEDVDEIINQEIIYNDEDKIEEKNITIEKPKNVSEEKKFKNSEVISPVFGIYKQEQSMYRRVAPKREEIKKKEIDDIELEIEKTQEFLEELKSLRNKLN